MLEDNLLAMIFILEGEGWGKKLSRTLTTSGDTQTVLQYKWTQTILYIVAKLSHAQAPAGLSTIIITVRPASQPSAIQRSIIFKLKPGRALD